MKPIKKVVVILAGIFIVVLVVGEVGLRNFGFLQAPLYRSDDASYGYSLIPNQDLSRFNNHILVNENSMRSYPLRESDDKRILVIGDSVINGGNQTDHDALATTILEQRLSKEMNENIRVLNLSAGGWSIDNASGFIEKFGDFDSDLLVLVFNSHDAFAHKASANVVGTDSNFPNKQYSLALFELTDRYLIPKVKSYITHPKTTSEEIKTKVPNPGWNYFFNFSKKNNIPIIILLHPETSEVEQNQYNDGGQWIIEQAEKHNIPIIKELDYKPSLKNYRDNIHVNEGGQQSLSVILYTPLKDFLETH